MINVENAARRPLDLPNGLHFGKLTLAWYDDKDLRGLVLAGGSTLESLDLMPLLSGAFAFILCGV